MRADVKIILVLGLLLWGGVARGQQETLKWLTITEAEKLNKAKPRPFIFDFYTDWCGWCKHQDQTTYSDPVVISYINRHFYPVKINAETSDTVTFRGKIYPPVKNGQRSISGLAVEMLGGKLSYPTTVFVYDSENVNLVIPGYIDAPKMQGFLVYFSENAYLSTEVNSFMADFAQVFDPAEAKEEKGKVKEPYWVAFGDLEKLRREKPRKVLLLLGASWSNTSRMMENVVFTDSIFAAEVQKNFYCLRFDAQSTDTLSFMGHKFANAGASNSNLHQLAVALSDKILRVPAIYIFDEEGKLMEPLYYYLDRDRGRVVIDFLGNDVFKEMSWSDYIKVKSKEGF